ncbi:MAG: alpha/beta fold hydrolase [Pseudomonadota bacterium]
MTAQDYEIFEINDFTTQGGVSLRVQLAYQTYGTLNTEKDNAVVIPTFYGGRHPHNEYFFGAGRAIDPDTHFIVIPNMLGNGFSTSPSNTAPPYGRGAFPLTTLYDNVMCQHQLVTEALGIERLKMVTGFSMGAAQTFQWGALFPEMIESIAPICGASKISEHNSVFISSALAALKTDPEFAQGWYTQAPMRGLLAFGHVYAGWLFSQDFYREGLYEQLGLSSWDDVVRFTQGYFLENDANNLVAMANTWLAADISNNDKFQGSLPDALGAISCRAIVMPGETDLYFRVADNAKEVELMPNAELRVVPSKWGHAAGFGMTQNDLDFVDNALGELLRA